MYENGHGFESLDNLRSVLNFARVFTAINCRHTK